MKVFYEITQNKSFEKHDKNDKLIVSVRYRFQGRRLNTTTGVSVKVKDWDRKWRNKVNKEPIKTSDPQHKEKNLRLKQKLIEVRNTIENLEKDGLIPTTDLVKSHLRENKVQKIKKTLKEVHFLVLFEKYESWINSDSFPNRKSYVMTLKPPIRDVKEYTTEYQLKYKVLLLPSDINEDFITGLIKWCYNRGLQPSTIRKRTKILSMFSTWCRTNNYGDFVITKPKTFSPSEERQVICLFRPEVNKLFHFDKFNMDNSKHTTLLNKHKCLNYVDDTWTNKKGKEITKTYTSYEVYRDMLLFLCNVGCRFGDMVKMRVGDFVFDDKGIQGNRKGYFRFYMEKSRTKKEVKVSINQMTDRIFRKYVNGKNLNHFIFPRTEFGNPISNQKFNKHSKHIGEIVGLNRMVRQPEFDLYGKIIEGSDEPFPLFQKVVSHIGRRTFIREHIERGTPIRTIMKMTGHTTQKVFDGYYSILDKDILSVNDDLYSQTLKDDYNSQEEVSEPNEPTSIDVENELKRLQEFFDKGILPEKIYEKKVEQILGVK
ncbi:tyrosine-type recombinase/integrase [Flavobacteriaceae bacterium]|nr:tyrosine-type recombinase/integrase [Flavobacteriaceae bacterium]